MEAECCALAGTDCRPTPLRRRAGRPQLKRDPLGGTLPPHKHPFVNSFWYGEYARRRAPMLPKGDLCSAPYTPRPRYGAAAPRTSFRRVAAQSQVLIPRAARAPSGARRARASLKSAPSNMRLKLTGALVLKETVVSCPGGHGLFVHYSCAGGRVARSLSAIR